MNEGAALTIFQHVLYYQGSSSQQYLDTAHTCTHMYTHAHINTHTHTGAHTHTHTNIHTHTLKHTHTQTHIL